jgi:hypothetical protein
MVLVTCCDQVSQQVQAAHKHHARAQCRLQWALPLQWPRWLATVVGLVFAHGSNCWWMDVAACNALAMPRLLIAVSFGWTSALHVLVLYSIMHRHSQSGKGGIRRRGGLAATVVQAAGAAGSSATPGHGGLQALEEALDEGDVLHQIGAASVVGHHALPCGNDAGCQLDACGQHGPNLGSSTAPEWV